MSRYLQLILLVLLMLPVLLFAEAGVTTITDELDHPWGMAFLPDGQILVTERSGQLRIIRNGKLLDQPIKGLPEIAVLGQGGLLDVVLHPDYEQNGWIYISYASPGQGGAGTAVSRGRLSGLQLVDVETIFSMSPRTSSGYHFGSRMVFDRAGYLYFTIGDRGDRPRAQKLDDHAGSVIRLHDDGSIPEDNPFVGREGLRAEIFSYGHRNPQGMTLHPETGAVWLHEHGPKGGDEVNIVSKGRNYGWPVITYGVNYGIGTKIGEGTHKEGMDQPLYYWVPSIAPSGMAFHDGYLYVGSLKFRMLTRLSLEGDQIIGEERVLKGQRWRIRDVRSGPDGALYLLTDESDGRLLRIVDPHELE